MAGEYEFGAGEEEKFDGLSSAMKFVGIAQIVLAIVRAIGGFAEGGTADIVGGLLGGIVFFFIGFWTVRAADSVQKIVDTRGSDVSHLMDAVDELTKLYSLQRILIIVAIVLIGALGALAMVGIALG